MIRPLRNSLVVAAVAMLPAVAQADADNVFPAIIVGSGYGGSIAAYNLARRHVANLVIERGRWWKVVDPTANEPFPTAAEVLNPKDADPNTQRGDPRAGWLRPVCGGNLYTTFPPGPDNCTPTTGLVEVVNAGPAAGGSFPDRAPKLTSSNLAVLTAAGVGGGSLVNNGLTFAPPKMAWDVAFPPSELPYMQDVWQELNNVYFKRAFRRLDPSPAPADVLASGYYAGTTILYDFFGQLGYPEQDTRGPETQTSHRSIPPVIADWDAVRDEIAGVRVPSVINGEAWWGINSGAKKSVDTDASYLGRAIATGQTTVKALHTVSDISYDPQTSLFTVTAVQTDEAYNTIATLEFKTPNLIMAAGSLGTTKLLVRARERGSLANLNSHVGTRFSNNGNTGGLAFVWPSAVVDQLGPLPQGGPAGIKVFDGNDPANPITLESLPQPVPAFFAAVPQLRPFFGAVDIVGIGVPQQTGNFSYDAITDSVSLNWPVGAAHNVYQRFHALWSQFPGYAPPPSNTPVLSEAQATAFTLHPLGGVPLGLATDMKCGLKGYDGLYAVDGSIVPGAAAASNPTGLIAALAERCMKEMRKDVRKRVIAAKRRGQLSCDDPLDVEDVSGW